MKQKVRVLLADDSPTVLDALSLMLAREPDIEVVGRAKDGVEAVSLAKLLGPDVITMDVMMPRLDGLEATAAILAEVPTRVLIVSSVGQDQMDLSFRAMSAGALELIAKPVRGGLAELEKWGSKVAESIRLMSEVPVVRRRRTGELRLAHIASRHSGRVDAVGIAASTGGPPALEKILAALPADLPIPILVAQHITEGFTRGLVRWLAAITPLTVQVAEPGAACLPGRVYLAPDGHDLSVDPEGSLRLSRTTGGHCPSGNLLLRSLARAYGARACGVVLTGMGDDGAEGLLEIRRAGGHCLAQDEATSVVFGMPAAAQRCGAADILLPLGDIAANVIALSRITTPASGRNGP